MSVVAISQIDERNNPPPSAEVIEMTFTLTPHGEAELVEPKGPLALADRARMLTPRRAAWLLGVSRECARKMIRHGELEVVRVGGREIVTLASVHAALHNQGEESSWEQ